MKKGRRMNVRALEAVAARTNAQVSENATDSPHVLSLVLKGNDAAALARRYVVESIQVLREVAMDPTARHRDRLEAARLLLDRAYGRPATVIQESVENTEEINPRLADIDRQGEAIEWMNSGRPQEEWPERVRRHLGLDDTESPDS